MSIKIKGFDKLQKTLNGMKKKAKDLDGTHEVSLDDLFPESFMREFTDVPNIDDFFSRGDFKLESQLDLDSIPEHKLDELAGGYTRFPTWKEMLNKAGVEWSKRKLGF